jgi:hypothetical protein
MAPVPHLPSGPAASRLARADRPWRPTSSSLFDRCPQRAYYRFYYGRPRIVVDTKVARQQQRPPRTYSAAAILSSERVRSSLDTRGIIASSCSSVIADQS